jgi:hypothetical protein
MENAKVAQVVLELGTKSEDISNDLALLQEHPHQAVALLVAELHPIPRKMYYEKAKTKNSRHVISCLRALHYLTGLTFSAVSAARLTDDERQFLDFKDQMHDANPGHELHFFGVWMSRNADCLAPQDSQTKIIEQWRAWQSQNAESFRSPHSGNPANFMEQWFWFG